MPRREAGRRLQGDGCGGVSVRADAAEQLVAAAVIERVESAAFAKALRSRAGGDRKTGREVTKLNTELAELEQAKASGALSLREYIKFRDGVTELLGEAQARMAGDTKASAVGRFAGQTGALRAWWDDPATTLDRKQSVLRAVIEKVIVNPVGKGGRTFDQRRVKVIPVA